MSTRRVVALELAQQLVFQIEGGLAALRHRRPRHKTLVVTDNTGEFRQRVIVGKEFRNIIPATRKVIVCHYLVHPPTLTRGIASALWGNGGDASAFHPERQCQ